MLQVLPHTPALIKRNEKRNVINVGKKEARELKDDRGPLAVLRTVKAS